MPDDQRKDRRREVALHTAVYTAAGWRQATSRDLSRGGVCLVVEEPIAVGTEIAMQISLVFDGRGQSEPLELRGRVVWCTPVEGGHQVGAAFSDLTHERLGYVDAFLHFLDQHDEEEPPPADGKKIVFD